MRGVSLETPHRPENAECPPFDVKIAVFRALKARRTPFSSHTSSP
jgi:hypothetical protein